MQTQSTSYSGCKVSYFLSISQQNLYFFSKKMCYITFFRHIRARTATLWQIHRRILADKQKSGTTGFHSIKRHIILTFTLTIPALTPLTISPLDINRQQHTRDTNCGYIHTLITKRQAKAHLSPIRIDSMYYL